MWPGLQNRLLETLGGSADTPPATAALKGAFLETIALDATRTPALASRGVVPTTAAAHRAILRKLASEVRERRLTEAPLPTAIVEILSAMRAEKRWQWSTMATKLGTVQGALKLLPLYTRKMPSVALAEAPVWTQALKAVTRKANAEAGFQPKPATETDVERIARQAELPVSLRAAVLLAWLTAARCGCVLQLRKENVTLTDDALTVQFRRGKGVLCRGPYTVHTAVPREHLPVLQAALASQTFLSGVKGADIKEALRAGGDSALEQRSLRRGALHALASAGVPEDELLQFSGHTCQRTLRRYLDWGKFVPQRGRLQAGARIAFGQQP